MSPEASMNIFSEYTKMERGIKKNTVFLSQLKNHLARNHFLSDVSLKRVNPRTTSSYHQISCADLDPIECKYILTGDSDGFVAIHNASAVQDQNDERSFKQIGMKRRKAQAGDAHDRKSATVSNLQWFPVDAGLFVSSNVGKTISVWDPNSLRIMENFDLGFNINHIHMSSIASNHSLLAAGVDKGMVVLCDLRSGSSSHSLCGHEGPIRTVQWSRSHQYFLYSGSEDGTIRLYDVRSGKSCLQVLRSPQVQKRIKRGKKAGSHFRSACVDLRCSFDGLWLYSLCLDGMLTVWNTASHRVRKTISTSIDYRIRKSGMMSLTPNLNPDCLYIPHLNEIFVYNTSSGKKINTLRGHMSHVFGTIYNAKTGDLYSYGYDKNFLVWKPKACSQISSSEFPNDAGRSNSNYSVPTEDAWSDVDE